MANSRADHFRKLDRLRAAVKAVCLQPAFGREERRRERTHARLPHNDREVLRTMAELIAYSQNAQAKSVGRMLKAGALSKAFQGYEVDAVARLRPASVKAQHWEAIRVIRFPRKLRAIIGCARTLQKIRAEYGGFAQFVRQAKIPRRLQQPEDVDGFWQGFDRLQARLAALGIPFFRRTTSLLHLLLSWGYDCVKPDLVVMATACELGLADASQGEHNRRQVVRLIQEYALTRGLRSPAVDFYLLIYGDQTWARKFRQRRPARVT